MISYKPYTVAKVAIKSSLNSMKPSYLWVISCYIPSVPELIIDTLWLPWSSQIDVVLLEILLLCSWRRAPFAASGAWDFWRQTVQSLPQFLEQIAVLLLCLGFPLRTGSSWRWNCRQAWSIPIPCWLFPCLLLQPGSLGGGSVLRLGLKRNKGKKSIHLNLIR